MGIGFWQLVIIALIVALVFGTSRLRNMGKDIGGAVKGFKDAMNEGEESTKKALEEKKSDPSIVAHQDVEKEQK